MKNVFVFALLGALSAGVVAAQESTNHFTSADPFWVSHWSHPKTALTAGEEQDFYQNMKDVTFAQNVYDRAQNPEALDQNAQWLKEHPNGRIHVDGYASSLGEMNYNLRLSQRRADWVRQELINRGVPENQVGLAVGWGELYPTCIEQNQECWNRNKLVRLTYVPNI